ncbi:MAG: protein kinase [Phycisphaerales bacterium]
MADGTNADESLLNAPRIDGHEVVARLGDGGCASVWKCREHASGRLVAVKVPRIELVAADFIGRFEDECQLLLRLRPHPNVVGVIGRTVAHLPGGRRVPALAMEYIANGRSLLDHADVAALGPRERLLLFRDVCAGVAHLHKAGIVHLDLKPKNILVDDTGTPRVMDLGAAKVLLSNDVRSAFFTAQFASPEQLRGAPEALEQTSDVYSLGKILAALVAGPGAVALPDAATREEKTAAALAWGPERFSAALPRPQPAIERIVARATAPIPAQRYADAADIAQALDDATAPWTIHASAIARRIGESIPGWAKATAVLALLGAVAAIVTIPVANAGFVSSGRQVLHGAWPTIAGLDGVRIVHIPENADFAAIESATALTGLSCANKPSLRALYAVVIERLARAGAAVVVLDVAFPNRPDFVPETERLATAIRAAREADCRVVVAIQGFATNPTPEKLAPALLKAGADFGDIFPMPGIDGTIVLAAATERPGRSVARSLSAAAVAALLDRSFSAATELDAERATLSFRSSQRDRVTVPLWRIDTAPIVAYDGAPIPLDGVQAGDRVALLGFSPPPADLFQGDATRSIEELLALPPSALESWVRGKIVLIANNCAGEENYPDATGPVRKYWWHATAIELMLHPPADSGDLALLVAMCAAGMLGAAIGAPFARPFASRSRGGRPATRRPGHGTSSSMVRRAALVAVLATIALVAIWYALGRLGGDLPYRPTAVILSLVIGVALGLEGRMLVRAWAARGA